MDGPGPPHQGKTYDDELKALTRENGAARRLATVPGIGVINAIALLAAVGDASAFAKGREVIRVGLAHLCWPHHQQTA